VRTRGPFWVLFQTVPVLLSKEKLITEERFVVNVRRSSQREREWILFKEDYPEQAEVFIPNEI
jgi:hypothetical protein